MANEGFYLTREQMERMVRGITREEVQRANNAVTVTTESGFSAGEDHQAPETHIAMPRHSEGIPGLNHFVQNVMGEHATPGFGECDIYRVIEGRLSFIERSENVYNLSEENVRNDVFPVVRTKFGSWIVVNKPVEVEGILFKDLEPAEGPFTGAVFGYALLMEWGSSSLDDAVPDRWKATKRELRFVNRSVNFQGRIGTYGRFGKNGGEFRPNVLDCKPSEEGVQVVVEHLDLVKAGIGTGVMGSGIIGG